MTAPTDQDLVRRCRSGDARAFDTLVLRHRERAVALAHRLASDFETAEDLVQEAFLVAARALPTLREEAKFGPWLHVILRRLALRHRANGRVPTVSLEGSHAFLHLPAPQEDEATTELRERVRAGLGELHQQHRQVLELFYLEGLSCREVAARTGLPVGTVKRRLHESRQRFRKEWRKMERAARASGVARHLSIWTGGDSGSWGQSLMYQLLSQSVALAINKRPLTPEQIGERVGADPAYVTEVLGKMVDLDFVAKRQQRYVLNFLALERDEYQQLLRQAQAMGQEMAAQFAPVLPRARALFEETRAATRGWSWEDVQWPFVMGVLYAWGLYFSAPEITLPDRTDTLPVRSDGGRYTITGLEWPDAPPRLPHFKMRYTWQARCGLGRITWQAERIWPYLEGLPEPEAHVLRRLAAGPKTLREATAKDAPKEALLKLVEAGLVRRRASRFEPAFPVFGPEDMDLLEPRVGALLKPAIAPAFVAEAMRFDSLLERQGYGRLSDQFSVLRGVLAMHDARGWAMHYLVERGELSPLPEEPAPAWGLFGWVNGAQGGIHHGSG